MRLANKLQDLGFGVDRKRDDFEIAGIPGRHPGTLLPADGTDREGRRGEGHHQSRPQGGAREPRRARRRTSELSLGQLRQGLGQPHDVAEERRLLDGVYRRTTRYARPERGEAKAVDHAIAHSYVRDAVLPERKLVTEALKRGLGAVTVEGVAQEMKHRPLIRSTFDGRPMATTKEMVALESKTIAFARDGRGRFRPLGDPKRPCSREWFNDGQKAAVRHVLGSRDRVMIIRGVAGTGKTTLEQEIGEALAEAGKPVVAIAQSVKASREILRQEAGFETADTVAMFLKDKQMQEAARNGVILVDEASQLGTVDMMKVFEVAEQTNARVILVGDRRQHRSVTAGEPLRLLEEKAGVRVAEVSEILRQQGDYKKAAKALSEGKTEAAFEELDKLGWIREVGDEQRYQVLADAYLAAAAEKKAGGGHKSALVVSPTHAEAGSITAAIRAGLKSGGRISGEQVLTTWVPTHLTDAQKRDATQYDPGYMLQFHQNAKGFKKGARLVMGEETKPPVTVADLYDVYRPLPLAVGVGDRIRLTAGGKTKDGEHRLSNGSTFAVQGFTKRGDLIVDHGWVIDREFGHLTHGYVVTSHASQGATVDKVIIGLSSESFPATYQRTAYVAVTRGKEQALIFTDDKEGLLKAMSRPDDPLSATEVAESEKQSTPVKARRPMSQPLPGHDLGNYRDVRQLSQPMQEMSHER